MFIHQAVHVKAEIMMITASIFVLLVDDITNTTGNQSIPGIPRPQIWHVVFADSFTCHNSATIDQPNFISYQLLMLNPDVLGNPTVHFSDEDIGKTLTMYDDRLLRC